MKPVATYCRWKNALGGACDLLFGAAGLGVGLGAIPLIVYRETQKGHASWGLLIVALLPLALGIGGAYAGIRSLRAALDPDGWLKAGPDGLEFRLPPDAARTLKWTEVLKWYPFVRRVNGVPGDRKLVFETKAGKVFVPGRYFRESTETIAANIAAASKRGG